MRVTRIEEHIHLIDLEPAGVEDLIASYVLKGNRVGIIESGSVIHRSEPAFRLERVKRETRRCSLRRRLAYSFGPRWRSWNLAKTFAQSQTYCSSQRSTAHGEPGKTLESSDTGSRRKDN